MIPGMKTAERPTEVVEAEGHLIDSQLLNVIFDTVIKWDASFEVLQFRIGRTNEEPSSCSTCSTRTCVSRTASFLSRHDFTQ